MFEEAESFEIPDFSDENISSTPAPIPATPPPSSTTEGIETASFEPAEFMEVELTDEESAGMFVVADYHQEPSDDEKVRIAESYDTETFIREDSLLSNAQSYAQTIRDGADIYKRDMEAKGDEIRREAENIREEAETIKRGVEQERQQILREAELAAQRSQEASYNEGYEAGRQEGIERRYMESEPMAQQLEMVLEQLTSLRQIVRFQAEQELVQLALMIAKNIVIEEITINPDILKNIIKSALKELESLGKVRIFLHPDDYEFIIKCQGDLEKYIDDEQVLQIKPNIDASPGSIIIETDEDVVNYSFQQQFEKLEEELSQKLGERHVRLHEVDMDSYNFSSTPHDSDHDSLDPSFQEDTP